MKVYELLELENLPAALSHHPVKIVQASNNVTQNHISVYTAEHPN